MYSYTCNSQNTNIGILLLAQTKKATATTKTTTTTTTKKVVCYSSCINTADS